MRHFTLMVFFATVFAGAAQAQPYPNRPLRIVVPAETVKALQAGELRERLNQLGFEVIGSTPEAFGALIRSETVRWAQIIRESGARAD